MPNEVLRIARRHLNDPVEMGMPSLADVEARVRASPDYRDAFAEAFGDHGPVTIGRIAQALAAYERTLITPDAPYDRFVRGDLEALTPAQLRGMALRRTSYNVCYTKLLRWHRKRG